MKSVLWRVKDGESSRALIKGFEELLLIVKLSTVTVHVTGLEGELGLLGAVPVWRNVSDLVLMTGLGKHTTLLLTSYDLCISGRAVLVAVVYIV